MLCRREKHQFHKQTIFEETECRGNRDASTKRNVRVLIYKQTIQSGEDLDLFIYDYIIVVDYFYSNFCLCCIHM